MAPFGRRYADAQQPLQPTIKVKCHDAPLWKVVRCLFGSATLIIFSSKKLKKSHDKDYSVWNNFRFCLKFFLLAFNVFKRLVYHGSICQLGRTKGRLLEDGWFSLDKKVAKCYPFSILNRYPEYLHSKWQVAVWNGAKTRKLFTKGQTEHREYPICNLLIRTTFGSHQTVLQAMQATK